MFSDKDVVLDLNSKFGSGCDRTNRHPSRRKRWWPWAELLNVFSWLTTELNIKLVYEQSFQKLFRRSSVKLETRVKVKLNTFSVNLPPRDNFCYPPPAISLLSTLRWSEQDSAEHYVSNQTQKKNFVHFSQFTNRSLHPLSRLPFFQLSLMHFLPLTTHGFFFFFLYNHNYLWLWQSFYFLSS